MSSDFLRDTARLIKSAQAQPPMPPAPPMPAGPQGAPPMPPMAQPPMPPAPPMPAGPQGAPMPPQGDPNAGAPQGDPLLDQLVGVFTQLPPGMFAQLVEMPTPQLVELAKSGQVPPVAIQLVLHLRMADQVSEAQGDVQKESSVNARLMRLLGLA